MVAGVDAEKAFYCSKGGTAVEIAVVV